MSLLAATAHPPGRHYTVRGHDLWVEEEGAGETILLLAGLGPAGSHAIFHPHFSIFTAQYRLVYVDLHGRGRSARPDDLTSISFAEDVADVAELLRVMDIRNVHLYGFSYGGLIVQALALGHPERIATVVLANTLHSPEMWQRNHENINREIATQFPERWERIEALRQEGVPSTDPRMQAEFAVASPLVRYYNPDNAVKMFVDPSSRNLALYPIFCGSDVDFKVGGRIPEIPDFRTQLRSIAPRMLVIAGRYDRALHPALQADFKKYAPQAEHCIFERSGSFAHIEEPDRLFSTLREFWKQS